MNRFIPGLNHLQVNNIFCIGRNYAQHARELGNPVPDEPIIFLKPNSSVLIDGGTVILPARSNDVHHEVEFIIAIGREGRNIPKEDAIQYIAGYGIGIDFTARDLQSIAKKAGKPWTVAKGFDTFAPISNFLPSDVSLPEKNFELELKVNDKSVQKGMTQHMLFSIITLISYISEIFTLQPGDLIFTGTPEGVGPVKSGDHLTATLNSNLITLNVDVQ
jgi:2-keto-4-pentenoate hydratase/2-oxohepta-3-ene-1,7-dioic acid hydratase in catechol pathway